MGGMGEMPAIEVANRTVTNYTLTPVEVFTFTSIISAVDPVAVLASKYLVNLKVKNIREFR